MTVEYCRRWWIALLLLAATTSAAQVPNVFPGRPPDAAPDDLEEVEEIADEDDVLPAYSGSVDATVREADILNQQIQELSLSHEEIRRGYRYGLSLGAGEMVPWQTYSLEAFGIDDDANAWGLSTGAGGFHDEGRVDDRHFDIDFRSQSAALTRRYFSDVLQPANILLSAGIVSFEGKVDPSGSDDLLASDDEKLQSTFRANGGFLGASIGLTALWPAGYYLEWSPVGLRYTHLFSSDLSRQSEAALEAVNKKLGYAGIYGLVNIKFGKLL